MPHRPRKRFGQNFLVDPMVIEQILTAIAPVPGEVIVEIGPGQGALSGPLQESGAELHVVEIDRDLAADLPQRVPGLEPGQIHVGDALATDLASLVPLPPGQRIRVVGNLPYNISTPLLVRLMESADAIRDMHFMLQKEVVTRMAASPGSRDYGRLTLLCQLHCAVVPLFDVSPAAFDPVPRVFSSFVRLIPHASPPVDIADPGIFQSIVTQAFSQRRKTLNNSLKSLMTAAHIREAGVDPSLRAEAIGLADYAALAKVMAHYASQPGGIHGS